MGYPSIMPSSYEFIQYWNVYFNSRSDFADMHQKWCAHGMNLKQETTTRKWTWRHGEFRSRAMAFLQKAPERRWIVITLESVLSCTRGETAVNNVLSLSLSLCSSVTVDISMSASLSRCSCRQNNVEDLYDDLHGENTTCGAHNSIVSHHNSVQKYARSVWYK